MVFPSAVMLLVANSTPMVDLDSMLNSLRVKRERRFDLPTPESPIRTTVGVQSGGTGGRKPARGEREPAGAGRADRGGYEQRNGEDVQFVSERRR
jgi:hypothetical protein